MSRLDYVLVDLDAVRAAGLIEQAISADRVKVNEDDVTSFTWIPLEELELAGAVLDLELEGFRLTSSGPWWVCRCGRKLYDHSSRGNAREYLCSFNASGWFQPADRTLDYSPETGLTEKL